MKSITDLNSVYETLLNYYGPQEWWPADSLFEVIIGAILTQNTAWTNVEKAILNLKQAKVLGLNEIIEIPEPQLAKLIRSSGYYKQKARRLKIFCHWLQQQGGIAELRTVDTNTLRRQLLSLHGIGPETADDILLYAFQRSVFVIDAYTKRIFSRLEVVSGLESYEELRKQFETSLPDNVHLYKNYHALIVNHGKNVCKKKPDCESCILKELCNFQFSRQK